MSCAKICNVLLSHTAPKQDLETCNALSCFVRSAALPPLCTVEFPPTTPCTSSKAHRLPLPLHTFPQAIPPPMKEAYRMEASSMINIRWWAKDYELPALMAVPAPGFPWWHPKESQAVRERVQLPCEVYEYLELTTSIEFTLEEDDRWILTPGPIRVKPDCTLYLCSPGVTVCPGLRAQPQKKHPLSRDAPVTPTPKDIKNKGLPEPAQKRRQVIELSDSEDDLDLPPQPLAKTNASEEAQQPTPLYLCQTLRLGVVLHFRLPPVSPPIASLKTLQLLLSSHAPHIVDISILTPKKALRSNAFEQFSESIFKSQVFLPPPIQSLLPDVLFLAIKYLSIGPGYLETNRKEDGL
ncbi:hypothetical protein DFH09DRAFT_1082890 [Mycena vulgaris]|nr:hypothetical protein DFH09DRAFT_1082890 [Mycena vulgaris]